MGEANHNVNALLAKTLPQFPPVGRSCSIELIATVKPKRHVLVMQAEDVRDGVAGKEVRPHGTDAWDPLPEGRVIHPLGERLPDELCDVVLMPAVAWANTVTSAGGAHLIPAEFLRVDLREFLAAAESSIAEKSRILLPV